MSATPVLPERADEEMGSKVSLDTLLKLRTLQLQSAEREADAAAQSKAQFLATISHEIRTPLNGVIGMTDLLLGTELNPEQREYADMIRRSGGVLLSLINDILDYAKADAGKMEIEHCGFHLRAAVSDMLSVEAVRARDKGLRLSWQIEEDVPDSLVGDPARLRQVIINLVSNAIKFTDDGTITLHIENRGESSGEVSLLFSVHDTGIGISDDRIPELFQPFTQGDPSTNRRYGGTGLGLSIAKQIVERMGGTIGARSNPTRGCTFWFLLGLGMPPGQVGSDRLELSETRSFRVHTSGRDTGGQDDTDCDPSRMEVPHGQRPARVLLVEDNLINQKLALAILNKAGYDVDVVGDGKQALSRLTEVSYHLVLMDIRMPEMDGWEATKAIRAPCSPVLDPDVPIIAMTAHAMSGDRDRCLAAGMSDYLSKPIRSRELVATVRRWTKDLAEMSASPSCPDVVGSSSGSEVFDRSVLLQNLDGDESLMFEFVELFLADSYRRMEELRQAMESQDTRRLELLAHSAKGAAGSVGAPALAKAAAVLETAIKRGNGSQIPALTARLVAEFKRFQTELRVSPSE